MIERPVTRGEEPDYQELFEHAPCGYLVLDLDGTLIDANETFLQLCGLPPSVVGAARFQDLISAPGVIYYRTHFAPALRARGSLKEVTFDLKQANGENMPVLVNAAICPNASGRRMSIRMVLLEARQRRRYERDLLRSRTDAEQMAEVVQHSSDAIVMLSPNGTILTWNRGAELMFGLTAAAAIERSFIPLLFDQAHRPAVEAALDLLRQGKDFSRETVCLHRDGRTVEVSIILTPHMEAPGTMVAFSAIIRDISEYKRAERALMESEKLASVGRLASSIAHEINNPLEAVTNLLYILETQMTDAETRTLVHTAQQELTRVSHITTQTLRFHRQSSKRTWVDVNDLLDSILSLYRPRFLGADITVGRSKRGAVLLFCYEGELRQILANLIGNAFDAMRNGGQLVLRDRRANDARTGAEGVRITVADAGIGMDRETLRRIFEPFFTTKGIGGTGLGLWITCDLIKKNHGSIRVRSSQRPGRSGTTFSLFFSHPPAEQAAQRGAQPL